MEKKSRLTTLTEIYNETLWKLLEATATYRAQDKVMAKEPGKVIKEVMDPKTMQIRKVTIEEMVQKNREAVESWTIQIAEVEAMLNEEAQPQKPVGVEKP